MAKEDHTRRYKKPLNDEEIKAFFKSAAVLTVSGILFTAGLILLVHNDILNLSPKGMQVETLKGFASRVEYALRYQTLLVFWLLFNVLVVIYGRGKTKAINPLDDSTEEGVQIFKNILNNSYESIIISFFSQLAFVSFAQPITILKYIPLINILQFVGRVTFFAGYPLQRSFGFQCTFLPNLFLVGFNTYKLVGFVFGGI